MAIINFGEATTLDNSINHDVLDNISVYIATNLRCGYYYNGL